jgi:hypothetical protein
MESSYYTITKDPDQNIPEKHQSIVALGKNSTLDSGTIDLGDNLFIPSGKMRKIKRTADYEFYEIGVHPKRIETKYLLKVRFKMRSIYKP